ncbi:MAG: Uma2 family endonuclease [Pirellulaceae bacterium]
MATTIRFEEQIEIPLNIQSLAEFRVWATSDEFPERGRIDFLAGCIEIEMSPEDFFCHGTLKGEIYARLHDRVKRARLGHLVTDRTRVSCPNADLSVEPDIVFLSEAALNSGRARLVPKAGAEPGRYVEVEGPPDLIVEIVSDTSVAKDTRRLPERYFRAGVAEFWLADARKGELFFRIHHRGQNAFEPATADGEGYQLSQVFDCAFRLDGARDDRGHWTFDLREKATG